MSHFDNLKQVYESDGLVEVLRKDWERTKEDIGDVAHGIAEPLTIGTACVAAYVAGPLLVTYAGCVFDDAITKSFKDHARLKTDEAKTSEGSGLLSRTNRYLTDKRKALNDGVYKAGAALTPSFDRSYDCGLGSFLTQDINFRKIGAIGAPVALAAINASPEVSATSQVALQYLTWPFFMVASPFGYVAGGIVDSLVGDLRNADLFATSEQNKQKRIPQE